MQACNDGPSRHTHGCFPHEQEMVIVILRITFLLSNQLEDLDCQGILV